MEPHCPIQTLAKELLKYFVLFLATVFMLFYLSCLHYLRTVNYLRTS